MLKKIGLIGVIGLAVLLSNGMVAGQNMKEGLWEITVTTEMPGMPVKMPPQTQTHCLTRKDMVPQKGEPGQECKVTKQEVKGDTVTWIMECKSKEGLTTLNGKVTYRGDSFEGVTKMKHGGMEMTQNLKGKWVGKCPN